MVVLADRMVKRSGWADCLNLSRCVLCLGETELPRLTASYRLFFEETYLVVQSVLRLKHEQLAVNAHLIGSLGVDVVQTELFSYGNGFGPLALSPALLHFILPVLLPLLCSLEPVYSLLTRPLSFHTRQ